MSQSFQKIKMDGQDIPEGYVTNRWFKTRFDANANVLLIVVGRTGSGKSWSCLRMCELWYKEKFDKPFPKENICFSLNEAGKRIRQGGLEKGEFIIIEEAGVVANALEFQNKIVKFFHYVLQSFRCKNIGVIFNLPNLNLLTKTARSLAHGVFETKSIDKRSCFVTLKPFYLQTNPLYGKTYQKFLRTKINHRIITVKKITVGKPSKNLIEMKNNFVDNTLDDFIDVSEEPKKPMMKNSPLEEAIKRLWEQGVTKHNDIAKILGLTQPRVSRVWGLLVKKGEITPVYLENAENYVKERNSTPLSSQVVTT